MSVPARTTSDLVVGILLRDYDTDDLPDLTPYIATASAIVDRVIPLALSLGTTLSSLEAELIERWLSAHSYCLSDLTYASKTTEGASSSFQGKTGMNLDATFYGQMAQMVDTSGALVALSKRAFAHGTWLGKPPSEQIPYEQRD